MDATKIPATAEKVIELYDQLREEEKIKVRQYLDRITPGYRFTADEYDDMVGKLEKGTLNVKEAKDAHFVKHT